MARKSNKLYVIGREAFVPHPAFPGLWIRTDLSWRRAVDEKQPPTT